MEEQDYINSLKKKNGYCDCPDLKQLYKLKKIAEWREHLSDLAERLVTKEYLSEIKYREQVNKFEKSIQNYEKELSDLFKDKKITLRDSGLELRTINCSICDQQIDIFD